MPTNAYDSDSGFQPAGPRRALSLFARAFTLRCPNCGTRGIVASWFRMRERCPTCGLRTEREGEDYFIGSMMFNLVLAEILFAISFVVFVVVRWPDVPWDALEIVAPLMMLAAPFVLFPFSKLAWLAFDIMLRPVDPRELESR
jgi:uncharacterized protein (DUF983 family)